MKFWEKDGLMALLLGLILPAVLLNLIGRSPEADPVQTIETQSREETLSILLLVDGETVEMPLEEYLVGVLLGEMPAEFEPEALKAQAVVARTYALRRLEHPKHPDATVCDTGGCCQEYRDPRNCENPDVLEKMTEAVLDTAGLVLTYGGVLIDATYFSSAGGRTEDALAVWGSDIPYLQATDSPEIGFADRYLQTVTMTTEAFCEKLGYYPDGPCETWLGDITYTEGGGVETMVIGESLFTGIELRRLLGLRSTAFVMTAVGDHVTITTRGFGHRVGMSQYGAQAMALEGSSYDAILYHYYAGTTLGQYIDKD